MPLLRAMAVHKALSGIVRDNAVNVFHFDAPAQDAAAAEAVAEVVRDFFALDNGVQSEALCNNFSGQVALTGHEVRVYPVDTPSGDDPRGQGFPPLHTEVYDHVGRVLTASKNLPSEVALCASFKNMASGAVPPAQRRGRMYWGPLLDSAMAPDEAVTEYSRPSVYIRTLLFDAATWLAGPHAAGQLVIYSRPFAGRDAITAEARAAAGGPAKALPALAPRNGAIYPVTDVWVDDEWDTVRRRGLRASTRLSGSV